MKKFFIHILFLFIAQFSFAQDTITTRQGEEIEGRVIEITEKAVRYYRSDQPEGPVRNIAIGDVARVHYADGTQEVFEEVEPKTNEVELSSVEQRYLDSREAARIRAGKDRFFRSGPFFDLLLGYGYLENREYVHEYVFQTYVSSELNHYYEHYGGIQLRAGHKWYFGNGEKYRPGIQATWLRVGLFTANVSNPGSAKVKSVIAPLGLGFTNVLKLKNRRGVECNLTAGPTFIFPDFDEDLPLAGIIYGVELKYRWNALALGVDFAQVEERIGWDTQQSFSSISCTFGFKF